MSVRVTAASGEHMAKIGKVTPGCPSACGQAPGLRSEGAALTFKESREALAAPGLLYGSCIRVATAKVT